MRFEQDISKDGSEVQSQQSGKSSRRGRQGTTMGEAYAKVWQGRDLHGGCRDLPYARGTLAQASELAWQGGGGISLGKSPDSCYFDGLNSATLEKRYCFRGATCQLLPFSINPVDSEEMPSSSS